MKKKSNELMLRYRTLKFYKENDGVICRLYKIFEFKLARTELLRICDKYAVKDEELLLYSENPNMRNSFDYLLSNKLKSELINTINKRKTIYINSNSDIPLLGSNNIGIVDRNTSLIELKPITGCNSNCIFCSVDDGFMNANRTDFVIEEEYLVEQLAKHIKENRKGLALEIHINCNGEALLYSELPKLLSDLKAIEEVKKVSLNTNGILLTRDLIVDLKKHGLDQINISIHSLEPKKARLLSGCGEDYDIGKITKLLEFAKAHIDLIIAPVWVKGYNDTDIDDIVRFAKERGIKLGLQNYLVYKFGRNIAKQMPWSDFYNTLREYEEKYKTKLILSSEDFNIQKIKSFKKPFKKNQIVMAEFACNGYLPDSYFYKKDDRLITLMEKNNKKIKEYAKIKITRDKHNIFYGILV